MTCTVLMTKQEKQSYLFCSLYTYCNISSILQLFIFCISFASKNVLSIDTIFFPHGSMQVVKQVQIEPKVTVKIPENAYKIIIHLGSNTGFIQIVDLHNQNSGIPQYRITRILFKVMFWKLNVTLMLNGRFSSV